MTRKSLSLIVLIIALFSPVCASAFSLKDLFSQGNGGLGDALTNVLEGVLTRTNITVADLAGVWTAEGSAVSFKSDNALAKAGGVAASAAIEAKLDPYYKQYGLTGAVFTISENGQFTLKVKQITLSGTIVKNDSNNTFEFKFSAFGAFSLGSLTAYVQKPPQKLEIMFDATKLKNIISMVANISGMSLAKTASSLLDNYDGLCVGFSLAKTGNAPGSSSSKSSGFSLPSILTGGGQTPSQTDTSAPSTPAQQQTAPSSPEQESVKSAVGTLFDLLKKGKK